MDKLLAVLTLVALAIAGGVGNPPESAALPVGQADCDGGPKMTQSPVFEPIPGLGPFTVMVRRNQNVIVQLSAVARVTDAGHRIELAYSIDGGPFVIESCPSLFTMDTDFQTRTAICVLGPGPGIHMIQPGWLVTGGTGEFGSHCITIETSTR
jgi:hypothetical protein